MARRSRIAQLRAPFVITLALGAPGCDEDDTYMCYGQPSRANVSCNPPFLPPWLQNDASPPIGHGGASNDAGSEERDGGPERDGSKEGDASSRDE